MNLSQIDFALVTSESLRQRIKSWNSFEDLSEDQFIDLIDYSKELVKEDPSHEILFLVVAKGVDEKEKQEEKELTELKSELEQAEKEKYASSKKKSELREKSKQILNSLYGI